MATTPFFGEVYLRTTLPYLSVARTTLECEYLMQALAQVKVPGPVLDMGCGHGRHLSQLAPRSQRPMVGIDGDALSLRQAVKVAPVARADFFNLPFRTGHFAAVYAWYSTLFTFPDDQQVPLFREVARLLRPGGRLIFAHVPLHYAERRAHSSHDEVLADGLRVTDEVVYDPVTRRDKGVRGLVDRDQRHLEAKYEIRYYPVAQLTDLLSEAALKVVYVHGDTDGGHLSSDSVELIVGAERG